MKKVKWDCILSVLENNDQSSTSGKRNTLWRGYRKRVVSAVPSGLEFLCTSWVPLPSPPTLTTRNRTQMSLTCDERPPVVQRLQSIMLLIYRYTNLITWEHYSHAKYLIINTIRIFTYNMFKVLIYWWTNF